MRTFSIRRMLAAASLAACSCLPPMAAAAQQVTGTLSAVPQTGYPLDRVSEAALFDAVVAALQQRALRTDDFLVVTFEISGGPQGGQPPQGGFADPLVPQGAPLVRTGLLAVPIAGRPSTFCLPAPNGLLQCTVTLRVSEYRLFTPGSGWTVHQLMLHVWEWTGPVEGDRFTLALANTYSGPYASPDAFTELVASIFAVPPESVVVRPPTDQEVQMAR